MQSEFTAMSPDAVLAKYEYINHDQFDADEQPHVYSHYDCCMLYDSHAGCM